MRNRIDRNYVNAGIGALELYANVVGRNRIRNSVSARTGRTSGS